MSISPRILIVDDHPEILEEALPGFGYEITTTLNGAEAFELLQKTDFKFNLIILDVVMPVMNGWEFLKKIKNIDEYSNIPVLMLTGENEDEKEIVGLKFGADDYIIKPFKLPKLMARIEVLLRRSGKEENNHPHCKNDLLTSREAEILKLLTEGLNNNEIADKLCVQPVTVGSHLKHIFKKLKVSNRIQAAMVATKMNLV